MKVLGLDLGSNSIGWSVIEEHTDPGQGKILGMGSRVIPLSPDESDEFSKGNAISKNHNRTLKRTLRRGNDRYKARRSALKKLLTANAMMPAKEMLLGIEKLELFRLRDKAPKEQISLPELGRVFLQLNQRRGYRSSRKDSSADAKVTQYEQEINDRYAHLTATGQTIGQYFYQELSANPHFRVKEKVFPRSAYEREFDRIWETQSTFHPQLTEDLKKEIKNRTIYYQRELKSQKDKVSFCEFEGKYQVPGKKIFAGPKVAPQSSPIAQVCKLWESINHISIKNRKGEKFDISLDKKKEIFNYLDEHEHLSQAELFKLLGLGKSQGFYADALIAKKGLQGNTTKARLRKILHEEEYRRLLRFSLEHEEYEGIDETTGEVISRVKIKESFENEPLYTLWHMVYSIPDDKILVDSLIQKTGIPQEKAIALSKLDFTTSGFSKKSARAMRKILPYLQQGLVYSDACMMAGYNHSDYITKEENSQRQLTEAPLELLPKNSLRQPVVEKVLNQMINLVNAIVEEYGRPDVIKIELARELKQSKEERNRAFQKMNESDRNHKRIIKLLTENPEFKKKTVTRRDIERYKLWEEFAGVSPYEPSKVIGLSELFSGLYDIEHIIPKAKLFDDSFTNKTICPRHLNAGQSGKNNMTAFDFMSSRSSSALEEYLRCIENNKNISRAKRDRLLMTAENIPDDFIARQLRETQYISRKAIDILRPLCRHILVTSGAITDRLRKLWGWEDVIMNLQLPKYRALGKTEWIQIGSNGTANQQEVIQGWHKRDDHRHHAIDALVVACTQQGFIQRISTLNSQQARDEMYKELKSQKHAAYKENMTLLDRNLSSKRPFDPAAVQEAVSGVLISLKAGKKVAVWGVRKSMAGGKKIAVQKNILVPRGPLSEESVYGQINRQVIKEVKLGPSFTEVESIINPSIRATVAARLAENGNDPAKAFKNLKKNPVFLEEGKEPITTVKIMTSQPEFVIKYPVQNITPKDLEYVVDDHVRQILERRLAAHGNNPKEAFKNLDNDPVWLNEQKGICIKSVRCYTGLNVVSKIEVADREQQLNYNKYVKPGNNHHIAIYVDEQGKRQEHVVTFWHAVERKKYRLPAVITDPAAVWDHVLKSGIDDQEFLNKLPRDTWKYETSMQQNEMFVFNLTHDELAKAIAEKNYTLIGNNLFRVRKITSGNYWFNHQYETAPRESVEDKKAGRCIQASLSSMKGIKVRINYLGQPAMADGSMVK